MEMNEERAKSIEDRAADRAYRAGLGAGEWESCLTIPERRELALMAKGGLGTWGREMRNKKGE